jgi:hypothetical protein
VPHSTAGLRLAPPDEDVAVAVAREMALKKNARENGRMEFTRHLRTTWVAVAAAVAVAVAIVAVWQRQ